VQAGEGGDAVDAGEGQGGDAVQVDLAGERSRTSSSGSTSGARPIAARRAAVASAPGEARVTQIRRAPAVIA
jgi:hypothetical protein